MFVTMIELYNEKCFDLLRRHNGISRTECKIRQDNEGFYTDGCRQIRVNTIDEALRVIKAGRQNLTVAATQLNKDSSRSHLIFTMKICRSLPSKSSFSKNWMVSSIAFCDLAGVERRKKMGAQLGSSRSAESKTINKSLLQLRMVIGELYEQQSKPGCVAVGFRNSNLTRLMQCYLVGDSTTRIVIAISNDPTFREETYQSLVFASKASTVCMGHDKMGRKSRSKSNVSVIREDEEQEIDSLEQTKVIQQAPKGEKMPNYRKFTKEEMIADLEYYYEHSKKQYIDILTLKNGWKKEEYDARKLRVIIYFKVSNSHSEVIENVVGAERRTRDRLVQCKGGKVQRNRDHDVSAC